MKSFKTLSELEKHFMKFSGCKLGDVNSFVKKKYQKITIKTNKGVVGQILEATTGRAPNSNPNPDIENLGVELKVLPVRKVGGILQPKERSKIKSLNYDEIAAERWETSSLKKKIQKILFLVYEQPTGYTYKDWRVLTFKRTLVFNLENEKKDVIRSDWEKIKEMVRSKNANLISESDSEILGACTSGSGKEKKYGGGFSAKERSFAFRHPFMKVFYKHHTGLSRFVELNFPERIPLETHIVKSLNMALEGFSLGDVTKKHNVCFNPKSKSSFRLLINSVLRLPAKSEVYGLQLRNITIKTIPVDKNYNPWEAMSFPKFSLIDLLDENWGGESADEEDCVFKNLIKGGFIFVPIIKEKEEVVVGGKKKKGFRSWQTWRVGTLFFWKIKKPDLDLVKKEWMSAKKIVEGGVITKRVRWGNTFRQENNLLKQSSTKVIHMRPHAKDSNDIDKPFYNRFGTKISWQSFWLNKTYIKSVLSGLN